MKKILVVDDDPLVRELVVATLQSEGFVINQAANGKEAIAAAEKEKPDIILMDIMMPILDGISACAQIKAMPELTNIHIVMLSAKSAEEDIKSALEAGANDYFSKPFSPIELINKINSI